MAEACWQATHLVVLGTKCWIAFHDLRGVAVGVPAHSWKSSKLPGFPSLKNPLFLNLLTVVKQDRARVMHVAYLVRSGWVIDQVVLCMILHLCHSITHTCHMPTPMDATNVVVPGYTAAPYQMDAVWRHLCVCVGVCVCVLEHLE